MNELLNNVLSAVVFVGVFSGIAVEVLKRAEVIDKRFLPLASVVIGAIVGFVLSVGFNQDVATFIAAGFIGGAMASGIYDSGSSAVAFLKDFMGGNK